MRTLSVVLVVSLLLVTTTASGGPISELRQQLQTAYADMNVTQERSAKMERQEQQLAQRIRQGRDQWQELTADQRSLADALEQQQAELASVEQELARVRQLSGVHDIAKAERRESVDAALHLAYRAKESLWTRLFNALFAPRGLQQWAILEYTVFSESRAYAQSATEFAKLSDEQQRVYERFDQLGLLVQDTSRLLKGKQQTIRDVRLQLERDQGELQTLSHDQEELRRRLEQTKRSVHALEEQLTSSLIGSSFPVRGGDSLAWPLSIEGQITSDFGYRIHPVFQERRFHTGVDVAAPTGTPILAAADGIVSVSESMGGYGLTIVLDHGLGLATMYAHASELLVIPGQRIQAGETIALVGSTGISTGPHLHFEVRESGDYVDPWIWLD